MLRKYISTAAVIASVIGFSACGDAGNAGDEAIEAEIVDQPDMPTDEVDPRVPTGAVLMDTSVAGTVVDSTPGMSADTLQ